MKNIGTFDQNGLVWQVTDKVIELAERHFDTVDESKIVEALEMYVGMIPMFFNASDVFPTLDEQVSDISEKYGFPTNNILRFGGHIGETGYYISGSEDPDLKPIARTIASGRVVLVYEYAFVGIKDIAAGTEYLMRLD